MCQADTGRWSHCFRMQAFAMAPICGIPATKVLMIMFGSTASSGNYLSEKGRFSFGCTVLFSFLRAVPAAFIGGGSVPFRPLIERIACGKRLFR